MSEQVLIEEADGVLTLTLNRPEKKNALGAAAYHRLAAALDRANLDPQVRVVLLQAQGDMFSAGHDVSEFRLASEGGPRESSAEPFLYALAAAEKPLVAAVQGRAVGVGLTMLLHCDLVYVAEDAQLSCPFADLALTPEAASSLLLPDRIGHVRAFELFTLGAKVDGRTAAAWGLANAALPASEVQDHARSAAKALAARPPEAVRITKALMRDRGEIRRRIDEELQHFYAQLQSEEARRAFAAFLERRRA